jgi:hypothetical protein
VARFDLRTKELKGFVIHDFGGIQIHPPTLKASTGLDLNDFVLPGHWIAATTLQEVYNQSYHTTVQNHLQRLIRVLQLHYNGLGWKIVREQLIKNIPIDHPLYDAWLSPSRRTVPGKSFMVMRMANLGGTVSCSRWPLDIKLNISKIFNRPFPNLIHYTGTDAK